MDIQDTDRERYDAPITKPERERVNAAFARLEGLLPGAILTLAAFANKMADRVEASPDLSLIEVELVGDKPDTWTITFPPIA